MRIFEPILGEKASSLRLLFRDQAATKLIVYSLVSGDHTRTIQIATPTVGGLMKFAVKTVTCLGCKTPLRGREAGVYICLSDRYGSILIDHAFVRWCRMQKLQTQDARIVP